MDYFGINSSDELPKIREVLAEQMVEPTQIRNTELQAPTPEEGEPDADALLSVTEEGELIEKEGNEDNNA
jgi:segregation and condensation protein B